MNDSSLASAYTNNATALKKTYNDAFWLQDAGMYRDNTSTTLCPQDANSMAVLFGLADDIAGRAVSVSQGLKRNWNE